MAYIVEWFNGNCGDAESYDSLDMAMRMADVRWLKQSAADRKKYMTAQGAVFMVISESGACLRDLIEETERIAWRKEMADRAEDDPGFLQKWIASLTAMRGTPFLDGCIALSDGGWDGTETAWSLMAEHGVPEAEAYDMLDCLTALRIEREKAESED